MYRVGGHILHDVVHRRRSFAHVCAHTLQPNVLFAAHAFVPTIVDSRHDDFSPNSHQQSHRHLRPHATKLYMGQLRLQLQISHLSTDPMLPFPVYVLLLRLLQGAEDTLP